MKIGAVGYYEDTELVDCIEFGSGISFLDYDLILLDMSTILCDYYTSSSTYLGLPSLNDDKSAKLVNDCKRRKKEIAEMLRIGRPVIVFTPEPIKCYIATGERTYSGTGKNRQTTRIVNQFDITSIFPFDVRTEKATGEYIDCTVNGAFRDYLRKVINHTNYTAYFESDLGEPIYKISGTDKVVGSLVKQDNGIVLFLPKFFDDDNEELNELFWNELIALLKGITVNEEDFYLPEWTSKLYLPEEKNLREEGYELEDELIRLKEEIKRKNEEITKLVESKLLITGSGRILELKVKEALEDIGLNVTEGLPGRDDLIVEYNNQHAVIEVKGVSKSAAEKHAAQLEKWVSEYYSVHEIMPKGILIVNGFKDLPLDKRTEEVFPNQMLKYSEQREHCLLTGEQLLNLMFAARIDGELKSKIIESLFNTVGRFNLESVGVSSVIETYSESESED